MAQAGGEAEFLQVVRETHASLENKCLRNVRIEESFVRYLKDGPTPPRHNHYLANSDTYLIRTWTAGATEGFVERIVINRPDGRYTIGKRDSGEYVLGAYRTPQPVPESLDATFYQTFPFSSVWTRGTVADFLSQKTTTFQVIRRDGGEIEIEGTNTVNDPQWPFALSKFRITFDDQTYAVKAIRGKKADSGWHIALEVEYKDGFPRTVTFLGGKTREEMKVARIHEFAVYPDGGCQQIGIRPGAVWHPGTEPRVSEAAIQGAAICVVCRSGASRRSCVFHRPSQAETSIAT
ncbi:MAG: hypothetical protein EXS09_21765 [Gemmataceae bacterium]|nr:hypothetical protein [Gemmataceae bacterium]